MRVVRLCRYPACEITLAGSTPEIELKLNSLARVSLAAMIAILPATLPAQDKVAVQQVALEKESLELIDQIEDVARSVHYNTDALTGARADEAAHVHLADLALGKSPSVRIVGKGNKVRICPLWPHTAEILKPLVTGRVDGDCLFRNMRGKPLTRFGIYRLVQDVAALAASKILTLRSKRISPHTIRHTTAVHLLRAGVDINTIRAWLGHVSLDTTNIYAEVDLEMKAKALAHCDITAEKQIGPWRKDPALMAFLKAL